MMTWTAPWRCRAGPGGRRGEPDVRLARTTRQRDRGRRGAAPAELRGDFTAALLADIVRKRAGSGEGPELAAWLTGLTQAGRLAVNRTDSREPHVCA
jgi:hypothetical protein